MAKKNFLQKNWLFVLIGVLVILVLLNSVNSAKKEQDLSDCDYIGPTSIDEARSGTNNIALVLTNAGYTQWYSIEGTIDEPDRWFGYGAYDSEGNMYWPQIDVSYYSDIEIQQMDQTRLFIDNVTSVEGRRFITTTSSLYNVYQELYYDCTTVTLNPYLNQNDYENDNFPLWLWGVGAVFLLFLLLLLKI